MMKKSEKIQFKNYYMQGAGIMDEYSLNLITSAIREKFTGLDAIQGENVIFAIEDLYYHSRRTDAIVERELMD